MHKQRFDIVCKCLHMLAQLSNIKRASRAYAKTGFSPRLKNTHTYIYIYIYIYICIKRQMFFIKLRLRFGEALRLSKP